MYYRDTEPRRNGNWATFGCGGQIRGANGFLRLWHPQSSVKLLFALVNNPNPCMFPADLILAPPAKNYRPPADPGEPYTRCLPLPSIDLGTVRIGNRNNSLFDVARFWSYAEAKPVSMHEWHERVRVYAQTRNVDFRRPLPLREVDKLALSVSTWVWSGGGRGITGRGRLSNGGAAASPGDACDGTTQGRGMKRLSGPCKAV